MVIDEPDVWTNVTEISPRDVRSAVADFPDKMESLLSDIRALTYDPASAYDVAQPEVRHLAAQHFPEGSPAAEGNNPYYEFEADAVQRDPGVDAPLIFSYTRFRDDMEFLLSRLGDYLDGADPSRLNEVARYLREAESLLHRAQGSNGMDLVADSLAHWDGEAAINFRHVFFGQFNEIIENQAKLLRSIGTAVLGYPR